MAKTVEKWHEENDGDLKAGTRVRADLSGLWEFNGQEFEYHFQSQYEGMSVVEDEEGQYHYVPDAHLLVIETCPCCGKEMD